MQTYARTAGVLGLISMVAGGFGEAYVPGALVVPGDATATAVNIAASESLFRWGFAAYLVEGVCDTGLTLLLYLLFRRVRHDVALLAVFFRVIAIAGFAMSQALHFSALAIVTGDATLSAFPPDQRPALAMLSLKASSEGLSAFMMFYGVGSVLLGYLVYRSGFLPRFIGGRQRHRVRAQDVHVGPRSRVLVTLSPRAGGVRRAGADRVAARQGHRRSETVQRRRVKNPSSVYIYGVQNASEPERTANDRNRRVSDVVAREQSRLGRFIRRRVPDPGDAEDVLQDVFFAIVQANDLLMPIEHVTGGLYRTARNRIIDLFRRRRPQEHLDDDDLLPSPDLGPDALYERSVLLDALGAAVAELPPAQREVFIAHEFDGQSFREMAAQTGVGINTLLSRKRYAVLHLRKRLQRIHERMRSV